MIRSSHFTRLRGGYCLVEKNMQIRRIKSFSGTEKVWLDAQLH